MYKNINLFEKIVEYSFNALLCIKADQTNHPNDYEIYYFNNSFSKIFGVSADNSFGKLISVCNFSECNRDIIEIIDIAINSSLEEQVNIKVNDVEKHFKVNAIKLKEQNVYAIILNDITEQENQNLEISALYEEVTAVEEELRVQFELLRETKNSLKVKEEIYNNIAHLSNDGFYYANFENGTYFVSDEWTKIFKLYGDDVLDKEKLYGTLHPDFVPILMNNFKLDRLKKRDSWNVNLN